MQASLASAENDRASLADVIERRQSDIEQRWLERVREEICTGDVEPTQLSSGIGLYLCRMAEELRGTRSLGNAAVAAWHDVTREHALTRVRLGFDIAQLTHELVLLRRTVTGILREEGIAPDAHVVECITDVIDAAIAASVKNYVDARDYDARRRQAQHLGFLAHEIRSPLSAAALSLTRLRMTLPPSTGAATALDRAERNLTRVHDLVNEVLLVERLEAAEVETNPVEIALGALIDDAVVSCHQAAERKGLEFKAEYDAAANIHADPKLVLTALEQLLENAVKYTDSGEVSLAIEEGAAATVFHVRDSCPGLSDEELKIVFEPFRRGRTGKSGTGLGLAIVQRAVTALAGEVHAESPAECGCHFWFTVPKIRH